MIRKNNVLLKSGLYVLESLVESSNVEENILRSLMEIIYGQLLELLKTPNLNDQSIYISLLSALAAIIKYLNVENCFVKVN